MREYLAALDAAAAGPEDRRSAEERVGADAAPAKSLSLTDPAAAWTTKGARKVAFGYGLDCLIDLRRAIVVDVEATPARVQRFLYELRTRCANTRFPRGVSPQTYHR